GAPVSLAANGYVPPGDGRGSGPTPSLKCVAPTVSAVPSPHDHKSVRSSLPTSTPEPLNVIGSRGKKRPAGRWASPCVTSSMDGDGATLSTVIVAVAAAPPPRSP